MLTLTALVVLAITFFIGSWVGAAQSYFRDSAARGLYLVQDLKALRQGKVEEQIKLKESMLDVEIYMAVESNKSHLSWVLFPLLPDNRRYLEHMAEYRKQYPSQIKSEEGLGDKAPQLYILANQELVNTYGKATGEVK